MLKILLDTLKREIDEELGITEVSATSPVGLIADLSTVQASRHIAFVYEAVVDRPPEAKATEEFSARSKFSGQFFTPGDLQRWHAQLDPWSTVVYEEYIAQVFALPVTRQTEMPLLLDD